MYSQTYVIKNGDDASREAFFQVGEHCYSGNVHLDIQHAFERVTLKDLPALVPIVQRQQNNLSYLCSARKIPRQSTFCAPLEELEWARNFVISEVSSDRVSLQLAKLQEKHSWVDDNDSRIYFELVGDTPAVFHDVLFIASRVYANGLRIDSFYFEGVIYLTLEEGSGEQPLLDVHFPDISGSGSGATLAIYDNDGRGRNGPWMKLSVWQAGEVQDQQEDATHADNEENVSPKDLPADEAQSVVKDISSGCYVQSYCILKSDGASDLRKVLFRFGSWCYAGIVELVPTISLSDIPYVVPALRVQQKKLQFVSDASKLPSSSPFALAMAYAAQIQPMMEAQAVESEANLMNLAQWNEPTQNRQHWLEDDASDTFFEFACSSSPDALNDVEMLATKAYNANGIVSISVYYGGNWYLSLDAGASGGDAFPLLDSKFPDFSRKGSGFNIQCYPSGIVGWPQLRKLSIWCSGGDQESSDKELTPDVNSVPAESSDEVSGEETPTQPDDGEEVSESCAQAQSQPEGNDCSNPEPEEEGGANKLEERLKAMADAPGEVAWDTEGKPASQTEEHSSEEKVAPITLLDCPEDGDIYAQLDWLDERLDIEIDGLKGYLCDGKK